MAIYLVKYLGMFGFHPGSLAGGQNDRGEAVGIHERLLSQPGLFKRKMIHE
jgi:hypothetical protein